LQDRGSDGFPEAQLVRLSKYWSANAVLEFGAVIAGRTFNPLPFKERSMSVPPPKAVQFYNPLTGWNIATSRADLLNLGSLHPCLSMKPAYPEKDRPVEKGKWDLLFELSIIYRLTHIFPK
jgi:hypothetical protein